ncbi:MAG: hypothetical protein AB3P11_05860 [Wolbachia pipientis]
MKELQRWFKLLFNRFKERMIKIGVDTLIFDEFEKIHTETEFTDDIADVLSEFIMWKSSWNTLS